MASRKRSKPDTEDVSRLSSAADDSPTTSASNSDLIIANKRARQSAPIDKIINVTELCEQVLSHLPLYDLLRAMQACRAFKATADNSHPLQKNLFLAPDLPRPKLAMSSSGTLLSGTRAAQHIAAADAAGECETGEFTCHILHPALQADPRTDRVQDSGRMGMVRYVAYRLNCPEAYISDKVAVRDSVFSSTARGFRASNLDAMFVTQPPVTSGLMYISFGHEKRYTHCCYESARNAAGLTFGDVFKTVAKIAAGRRYYGVQMRFGCQVFVVSAQARDAAERAGELSSLCDPTRRVLKNGEYVLTEGGFDF